MASLSRNIGKSVLFALNETHILQKSFSSPFQIGINEYSKTAKIYENLGIAEPPKKPPHGFARFYKEYLSKNPKMGTPCSEQIKETGKKWKELSPAQKQQYEDAYKKDMVIHSKQIEAFRRNLTKDQMLAIKVERKRMESEQLAKKQRIERRNTMASFEKPKKPLTAYFLFRIELLGSGETTASIAEKWAKLSENERNVYIKKAAELRVKYEKDLEAWEKQMISNGYEHLVRTKTADALKKADIQSVPNSSTIEVHETDEIKQNIDEVIVKDEQKLDSGNESVMKIRNENTGTITDTKTTYIISKFKKFFKS